MSLREWHDFDVPSDPRKSDCVKCGLPAAADVHTSVAVNPSEMAHLYNVLSDNAKPWNSRLREELGKRVTDTQAFNAQIELQGRII